MSNAPYIPIDVDAERSVLAAALTNPEDFYEVCDVLRIDDFGIDAHRLIFTAMLQADAAGRPIDAITVADELRRMRALRKIGGVDGLDDIMRAASDANIAAHQEIVAEKSLLRRLVATGRTIASEAADARAVGSDTLEHAEQLVFDIGSRRGNTAFVPMAKAVADAMQELAKVRSQLLLGHSTGLADLDTLTGGFQPGQLIIVAARPGVGKSAFALQLARHITETSGAAVPFLSYEMSTNELTLRMLATSMQYDLHRLRQNDFPTGMERDLAVAGEKMAHLQVLFDDNPPSTISGVRSSLRRLARRTELGCVIIDYLQLMEGDDLRRGGTRQEEIAAISRGLKRLAGELNVPIIALSQLSRNVDTRPNKRPILSDLRESGSLEQDASLVLFLYRDHQYNPNADPDLVECIIAKQRNGPVGTVWLEYQAHCGLFSTTERRGDTTSRSGGLSGGFGGMMRDPF